ncbi:replication-relaxation family protein [Actinomadura rupiterrae]|uniref:replication-relaxation family protein n=1 Tax=Actinomadura rupiterrae TaxID=559627 RepID=UPI0020A23F32|nr:replication-relaxation family protein [Actinomadura rupiterrae]MCP2341170.1 hypothetical protein [Actinomadura rupiterrae]
MHTARQLANHVGRGLARPHPRPRVSFPLLKRLHQTLTARDWWILAALAEHRVLTTGQLRRLAFDTDSGARHRLHTLFELRAVDRFRPLTLVGSAPHHYVLDKAGALLLAERREVTLTELPYRPDDALQLAFSRALPHTVAVNDFFTRLAAAARGDPDRELTLWWPERRCGQAWGDLIRPDGYGIWRDHDRTTGFFAEIDLGTEPLDTLTHKVDRYVQLAHDTGSPLPVLFQLPGPHREYGLHQALGTPPIPVATTLAALTADPAGPVWLPVGADGERQSLISLTTPTGGPS